MQPANHICSARNYEGKEDNDIKAYTQITSSLFWQSDLGKNQSHSEEFKKKKKTWWKFVAMYSEKLISYLSLIRLGFMVYKLKKI